MPYGIIFLFSKTFSILSRFLFINSCKLYHPSWQKWIINSNTNSNDINGDDNIWNPNAIFGICHTLLYIYREFVTFYLGIRPVNSIIYGICHIYSTLRLTFVSFSMGICHWHVWSLSRISSLVYWIAASYKLLYVYILLCITIRKTLSLFSYKTDAIWNRRMR